MPACTSFNKTMQKRIAACSIFFPAHKLLCLDSCVCLHTIYRCFNLQNGCISGMEKDYGIGAVKKILMDEMAGSANLYDFI